MSISLSILSRPISADRATPALSMLSVGLPSRLGQKLASIRQLRAERHMLLAVLDLGHPEVLADCQRATRN